MVVKEWVEVYSIAVEISVWSLENKMTAGLTQALANAVSQTSFSLYLHN